MRLDDEITSVLKRNDVVVHEYIKDGLRSSIILRPYQEVALRHFLCYETDKPLRTYPAHLLFHMATGSGKTVIMAALIIHLYSQGYRNFLFFVNSSNIVEKTKENFLTSVSSKYLFANPVVLDGKKINIRMVSNFDDAVDNDINIHFTTIQGLHSNLNNPKENAVTYEDFKDKKLVLISDEAHHINTLTKKKGKLSAIESKNKESWEKTVQKIFGGNKDNFLLEFTATIEMENANIKEKYENKIIYDYPLKKFRMEGYSKEVLLRQSQVDPLERMFQAVLFSQYRRKVAGDHRLHIKPVVLMKSENITESQKNTRVFIDFIGNITGEDIRRAGERYSSDQSLNKIYRYFFEEKKLSYENFAMEIKEDFSAEKIINVNNVDDLKNYQIRVNSLEDADNEIRVVFVVNKLNEGWDVLNLFDIARLEKRDNHQNQAGKTTIQEAQLIGRGARYCPFIDAERQEEPKEKRKYDQDTKHPLRTLEELHYHCSHNPKYISEIKSALQKTGMMDEPEKELIKVKESFKQTAFYQEGYIYVNEKIKNKNENKYLLGDYGIGGQYDYPVILTASTIEESDLSGKRILSGTRKLTSKTFLLDDIAILRRVADGIGFFAFDNIRIYLPSLNSMDNLFENIAKAVSASVQGDREIVYRLSKSQKKDVYHYVLSEIEKHIRENNSEFVGTTEFKCRRVKDVIKDKHIYVNDINQLAILKKKGVFDREWYVYEKNLINSYEEKLVQYIGSKTDKIKEAYNEFYLVRNEKLVKLYSFDDGRGLEPDFLLFAIKGDNIKESVIYQLFIEPKGEHLEQYDAWKEKFLKEIKRDNRVMDLYENTEYKIIGLPFYNKNKKHNFHKAFEEELGI